MSLQDDYFDLDASLKGENKKRFLRIWEAFCEMESEHDKLRELRSHFRKMVELAFPADNSKA